MVLGMIDGADENTTSLAQWAGLAHTLLSRTLDKFPNPEKVVVVSGDLSQQRGEIVKNHFRSGPSPS